MSGGNVILVVDDEPKVGELLRQGLERHGYRVVTALDGEAAWQRAVSDQPDLILLDVMMPKLDGFELLRRLKEYEQTRGIPVVMLTAKGDTGAIFQAQELRVTDYLTKPFDLGEILTLLRRYLGSGWVPPATKTQTTDSA